MESNRAVFPFPTRIVSHAMGIPRSLFLLSPASTAGQRARLLLSPRASFDLARRIRSADGAPIGEVSSFLSIATGRYADVLRESLAGCLAFPADFVGRGDLSRGRR